MEERLVRPAWPEGPELLKMGQYGLGVLSPSPAALANGGGTGATAASNGQNGALAANIAAQAQASSTATTSQTTSESCQRVSTRISCGGGSGG